VGGGHFTSGHLGLGHGGHGPQSLRQALLSIITGSCLGILDLRIYCDKSGVGGHSVFNIYCDKSGHVGQGGTEVLRRYLVISGMGGQAGQRAKVASQLGQVEDGGVA